MDSLKSDLNHNTRMYNYVKNWRGGGGDCWTPSHSHSHLFTDSFFWSISLPDKDGIYPV